jgi:hypothetical protein
VGIERQPTRVLPPWYKAKMPLLEAISVSSVGEDYPLQSKKYQIFVSSTYLDLVKQRQWSERLMRMSPGDELNFVGKINQFQNGSQFYLEECELT